jgi:hypothetical protein
MTIIIPCSPFLSRNAKGRRISLRPFDLLLTIAKTEKAGGGHLLSTHGFGIPDLIQLSVNHTFTPGRRPKIKAAPKVKGSKGEIAVDYHTGHIG